MHADPGEASHDASTASQHDTFSSSETEYNGARSRSSCLGPLTWRALPQIRDREAASLQVVAGSDALDAYKHTERPGSDARTSSRPGAARCLRSEIRMPAPPDRLKTIRLLN